ncbi:MAG: biotin--[acetyl-CoA-carboxylase] ligase [Lachnospiraceae bacterium]|nr:biotin--[acetyl-CoA-carboxylase] ligase [Lachnospiraceae bacterium]
MKNTDCLSVGGIETYLQGVCEALTIEVEPVVTSTNTLVYEKANRGEKAGYVLLAQEQTAGRGRQGHTFYSPKDTGIYMSILLRPEKMTITQAAQITSMAAVAVCEAIEQVTGKEAGIKWVNDIFMDGRKVCGILTEAGGLNTDGTVSFVVLGIGVNLYKPTEDFPEELREIAGAAFGKQVADAKNRLAAEILNGFMRFYREWDWNTVIYKYREKSIVIGRVVQVLLPDGEKEAKVLAIDDACHLVVRYASGEEAVLSSGEISIRME